MSTLHTALARTAPDVADFAAYLAAVYGSPLRGLAMVVRATPEYRAWRRRVSWCPVCKQYVPARRGRQGMILDNHRAKSAPCPGAGADTIVRDPHDDDTDVTRAHLLRLLGACDDTPEPAKEAPCNG